MVEIGLVLLVVSKNIGSMLIMSDVLAVFICSDGATLSIDVRWSWCIGIFSAVWSSVDSVV